MADVSRAIELIFSATDQTGGALSSIGSGIDDVNAKVSAVAEPIATFVERLLAIEGAVAAAGLALTTFAIKSAADFQESVDLIGTKTNATGTDLTQFKQSVLDYASTSSASFDEVTRAVTSAVQIFHDHAIAIGLVTQAEILGDATGNNLADTTKLLALALRDYGASADQAKQFSDVLFVAARDGGVNFTDLADTIGKIGPLAKASGLTFQDTAAALTTMARAGIDSGTASQALARILAALADPTTQVQTAAKQLGLDFSDSAVKTQGFAAFLSDLAAKTGNNTDLLKSLGFSARSLDAALALLSGSGATFRQELDAITNSAGTTQAAYAIMANQIGVITQVLENSIKAAAIAIGAPLVQSFLDIETAAANIFLAIKTSAESGAFLPLQNAVQTAMNGIAGLLQTTATNLPAALAGIDFSGFFSQLETLKGAVSGLFGGLDLTSAEGLRAALQGIVDLAADFTAFDTGLVSGFTEVKDALSFLTAGFGLTHTGGAELLGQLGAFSIAFLALSPLIGTVGSAFSLLGGTFSLVSSAAVALPGIITGISAALTAISVSNPIGLALFATAAIGAAAASTGLLGSLNNGIAGLLGFGSAAEASVTHFESLAGAAVLTSQGFGLLVNPALQAKNAVTDLTDVHLKLVDSFGTQALIIGPLIDGWEALRGHIVSTKQASFDFISASDGVSTTFKQLQSPIAQATQAISAYFESVSETGQAFGPFNDAQDLANRNFNTTILATRDAEGNITGFTQALTFAGKSGKDATDQLATGLSKTAAEALKAQQQSNDFNLSWEKIQSQERTAVFTLAADIQLAQIQAGTEQIKAAFESVNTTITSTGDTISNLVKTFADLEGHAGSQSVIVDLLRDENQRRQEALDLQKKLVEAQLDYLHAIIDRLGQGDAMIQVTADGLEPELEAFMFKILERVQMKASQEAQSFLLGLS